MFLKFFIPFLGSFFCRFPPNGSAIDSDFHSKSFLYSACIYCQHSSYCYYQKQYQNTCYNPHSFPKLCFVCYFSFSFLPISLCLHVCLQTYHWKEFLRFSETVSLPLQFPFVKHLTTCISFCQLSFRNKNISFFLILWSK